MGRKKKIESKSLEQLEQERLENQLKELREENSYIPLPTYKFNIGDNVKVGNLEDVTVEEILDNGKIYKVDYSMTDNNYGNPIKTEHLKAYFHWFNVRKINNTKTSFIKNVDLKLSYMQQTIEGLFSKVYNFGVDFEPEYQREFVWELEDKIALIDSIFNNIDIGKFVFIKHDYSNELLYEILDGKQRLRAILDFYEDKFQYKGCYFSDLSNRDKNHFEDYSISIAEVGEMSKEQILRYFIMLNTGGKPMAKEQLDKVKKMLVEEEK